MLVRLWLESIKEEHYSYISSDGKSRRYNAVNEAVEQVLNFYCT